VFHVGGGRPGRKVNKSDAGNNWLNEKKVFYFVPLETWDLWQKFKEKVGDVGIEREIERVRKEIKAAGGAKGDEDSA